MKLSPKPKTTSTFINKTDFVTYTSFRFAFKSSDHSQCLLWMFQGEKHYIGKNLDLSLNALLNKRKTCASDF